MNVVDVNGDGNIDYNEFADWVTTPGDGADVLRRMHTRKASTRDPGPMKSPMKTVSSPRRDGMGASFSDGGSTRAPWSDDSSFESSSLSGGSSALGPRDRGSRGRPAPFSHHGGDSSTPPTFYAGGFHGRGAGGLQAVHDQSMAHGAAWEAAELEPPLQRAGKHASPLSRSSKNTVDRTGVFEGGRQRVLKRREVDGETLAEETGIIALWRPKRGFGERPRSTALGHSRAPEFCARVEPDSRCFCGFTFIDHSAGARLGCPDGFAWKRNLAQKASKNVPGFSFAEPGQQVAEMPCFIFRYMPSSPAQTTKVASCADAYKAARGVPVEDLHAGWYAPCRNCGSGHQNHDPEDETCPVAYDQKVGNGRYQSAWECTVCNQRWENHETIRQHVSDYEESGARARAVSMRSSRNPMGSGEPITLQGGQADSRARDIERMLAENSHGISGKFKDSDHYGPGAARIRGQIQRENARFREEEEEIQQELARSAGTISYLDTTGAYREGRSALYGSGVEDERFVHGAGRRPQSGDSRLRRH